MNCFPDEGLSMLNNSFQVRYHTLPIATFALGLPPVKQPTSFILLHNHREFEVIVVKSGSCEIFISNTRFEMSSGDILLIPPYALHDGNILPGKTFDHYCFCFDLSILNDGQLKRSLETGYADVKRVIAHGSSLNRELLPLIEQIYRQSSQYGAAWEMVVRGALQMLVGRLVQSGFLFTVAQKNANQDFCIKVLDILGEQYANEITSRTAAAAFSYSQSYFCRLFRDNFNTSFRQYLCQFRLCKAKLLLSEADMTVSEAARQVGFNNLSYFTRMFKSCFGCTPLHYKVSQVPPNRLNAYYRSSQFLTDHGEADNPTGETPV